MFLLSCLAISASAEHTHQAGSGSGRTSPEARKRIEEGRHYHEYFGAFSGKNNSAVVLKELNDLFKQPSWGSKSPGLNGKFLKDYATAMKKVPCFGAPGGVVKGKNDIKAKYKTQTDLIQKLQKEEVRRLAGEDQRINRERQEDKLGSHHRIVRQQRSKFDPYTLINGFFNNALDEAIPSEAEREQLKKDLIALRDTPASEGEKIDTELLASNARLEADKAKIDPLAPEDKTKLEEKVSQLKKDRQAANKLQRGQDKVREAYKKQIRDVYKKLESHGLPPDLLLNQTGFLSKNVAQGVLGARGAIMDELKEEQTTEDNKKWNQAKNGKLPEGC